MAAVGIDLGTTQCRVAIFQHGKVEILTNHQGNRSTPSYVSFTDTERHIGDTAQSQLSMNPTNTVFDCKRLLGRRFLDATVQSDLRQLPFSAMCMGHKPRVQVGYRGHRLFFSPEEISAMLLQAMREIAETHLGVSVSDVVVSVPAYFNDEQRQATKDACTISGLNPLRILNDTTASALAYAFGKKFDGEKYVLIYDLGGGSLDVSVVSIDDGIFEVLSITGHDHLGGRDFDGRVADYLVAEFKRRFKKDLRSDKRAMCRVRRASERAKCELSNSLKASIELDSLFEGIDFYTTLTLGQFQELNHDLFKETLVVVKNALDMAEKSTKEIHEVLLVGGSTRIPMLRQLIKKVLGGIELGRSVNPDEVVACGAAVQAAILQGYRSVKDFLVIDMTAHSLCIQSSKAEMKCVISRNTCIPNSKWVNFTTYTDNSCGVSVHVFEGEEKLAKDNKLIGIFDLCGMPPKPRGVPQIEVTFLVDANGIMTVKATDKTNDISTELIIKSEKSELSKDEIQRMRNEAEVFRVEDCKHKDMVNAKNRLESYALEVRSKLDVLQVDKRDREKVLSKVDKALEWIESCQGVTKEDVDGVYYELVKACKTVKM